jgi:hypothetical protein
MRLAWVALLTTAVLAACGGADGGGDTAQVDVRDATEAIDGTPDACVPTCAPEQCSGDDGCGGECQAACKGGFCRDGACFACDHLSCDGQECGPSWECGSSVECRVTCGDACGTCAAGQACSFAGTCSTDPCAGVGAEGCCDGQRLAYCQNGVLVTRFCDAAAGEACGWAADFQAYDCGPSTDADPSGAHPHSCDDVCAPRCQGRACGDDGCGGSCGTCGDDTLCEPVSGTCASCLPDCTGRACGDDGCGGSCGTCAGDLAYCVAGQCQCSPQCAGRICGDDGCGGSCGDCDDGFSCVDGGCQCAPQCEGKQCGPDGCGNLCGVCDGGCDCGDDGTCQPPAGSVLQNACDGTLHDPVTGLEWPWGFLGSKDFPDARALCDNLATGGHDDWRLPTIDELRSLVVGCPATATDGPCPIHDACTSVACDGPDCAGCTAGAGPGPDGRYLDGAFKPSVEAQFWSVTRIEANEAPAFVVEFDTARVHWYVTTADVSYKGVRCVRGPDAD